MAGTKNKKRSLLRNPTGSIRNMNKPISAVAG
jgi:hypothetical protein